MASDSDSAEVKEMIQSLYRFANVLPVWDGEANDQVAEVFGIRWELQWPGRDHGDK